MFASFVVVLCVVCYQKGRDTWALGPLHALVVVVVVVVVAAVAVAVVVVVVVIIGCWCLLVVGLLGW